MNGLLLAANNYYSYIIMGVLVLLLVVMFVMMNARNKKESQKVQEQTNSLKVGDKVLTTSGVYGTIVELKFDEARKIVVLETGGKTKSYLSVDAYAIYTVFKSDEEIARDAAKNKEAEKAEEAKPVEEKPAEKPAEKKTTKTSTAKKTSTKTTTKKK